MISKTTNSEAETRQIGIDIAMSLGPGDIVLLSGDLGTGKTTLARAIIRAIAEDDHLEVPSPTYSICQSYDARHFVHHFDLYRLASIDELDELGWLDMTDTGIILMEWPENCFDKDPPQSIRLNFTPTSENSRTIEFHGDEQTLDRVRRSFQIRKFLNSNDLPGTERKFLSGDASSRAYELVNDGKKILMNSPATPDGPPVHDGKPYSKIAHLAESVSEFVAVSNLLAKAGLRVPEIYGQDLDEGLLLIENLGSDSIIDANREPIPDRYQAAVEALVHLHEQKLRTSIQFANNRTYTVPAFDHDAMMIEVRLLMDWYVPEFGRTDPGKDDFNRIWRALIIRLSSQPETIIMRDFHSPNILWLGNSKGTDRIGVIDFQDAVIGPQAYDLASLAQDARVDVSSKLEDDLVNHYISLRNTNSVGFDEEAFRESYAIMAAQRATKILGIFVRLDKRDGKPQYRKHIPRIINYLNRSLKHPVLTEYREWLTKVINL